MFKVIELLTAADGIDGADLADGWLAASRANADGLVRHVVNRVLATRSPLVGADVPTYAAIGEYWFEDAAAGRRFVAAAGDAGHPLLAHPPIRLGGVPQRRVSRAPEEASLGVKIMILASRRPGLSFADFVDHWANRHIPLAIEHPPTAARLLEHEICPIDRSPDGVEPPFDGIAAIRFRDAAALKAEIESDHYRDVLAPDEARFSDPARTCGLMVTAIAAPIGRPASRAYQTIREGRI